MRRVEPEGLDRVLGEQCEAVAARLGGRRALEQAVDEDHVRSGQLVATGDAAANEGPVVDEQLEVEPGRQLARVAVAARGLVDAPQPASERDVGRLDRIEEQRPVGPPVLDEEERGVAFELGQPERRLQAADDGLEEVAGDGRRVLDLAAGEVGRVAGEVRDDEETGLGVDAMRGTLDLGAAPMSIPGSRIRVAHPRRASRVTRFARRRLHRLGRRRWEEHLEFRLHLEEEPHRQGTENGEDSDADQRGDAERRCKRRAEDEADDECQHAAEHRDDQVDHAAGGRQLIDDDTGAAVGGSP